jgi:hypothetical protein
MTKILLPVGVLRSRRSVVATVALAVAALSLPASAGFIQTNLVSNIQGLAIVTDPALKNPWGFRTALRARSGFRIRGPGPGSRRSIR